MKTVLIFVIIHLVATKCYQFPNVAVPQYYVPIVNIRGVNASIVFLKHNNTDDVLVSSLVIGLYTDQSVIVSKGEDYPNARKGLLNKDPNIILVSDERITVEELDSEPFKIILNSFWSPVYLIITVKNGSMSCENGTFNKSFLKEIESCMNYIWHRHRIIRLVVSFPYTCPYHYIIYGKKKKSNVGLYDRTIKIIIANDKKELETAIITNSKLKQLTSGYPMRANIFDRFPTSIKLCDNINIYMEVNLNYANNFCGLDGLVMHDYINHYQFNLSVPKDETCDIYGFVEPNTQRMTGSLGCIIDNKMDISFNSRFMVQYTTKHFFYLHYITTDSLAVVLKRPEEVPLWHYAYNSLGPRTGIILNLLILVLGVVTWAFAWIAREIHDQEPRPLHIYIVNALTCTLFGFPIKPSNRFRILRGTSLLCSIIIMAFYQGTVNYQFTTRIRYREIKSLKQLYNSPNTLYTSPSINNLLISSTNDQDEDQLAYLNRTQLKNETLGVGYILEQESAATAVRAADVRIQVLLNFTDKNGSPLVYIVEEPFHVYYLSYICRTAATPAAAFLKALSPATWSERMHFLPAAAREIVDTPREHVKKPQISCLSPSARSDILYFYSLGFLFTEETVCFMMRLLEAGLPNQYYIWTRRTLKLGDTYPKTGADPRPTTKIDIQDLRVAFTLLAAGCVISTFSFFVEIYRGQSKKKYAATPS